MTDPVGKYFYRKRAANIEQWFRCVDLWADIPAGVLLQVKSGVLTCSPTASIDDHEDDGWKEIPRKQYLSEGLAGFQIAFEAFTKEDE